MPEPFDRPRFGVHVLGVGLDEGGHRMFSVQCAAPRCEAVFAFNVVVFGPEQLAAGIRSEHAKHVAEVHQ